MAVPSSTPDFVDLAARTGFSEAALRALFQALRRGHGRQAQFNHPELGGMGQWMAGGMTMVGDMSSTALAARVAAACALMADQAAAAAPAGWWPASLGTPSTAAEQDGCAYALFQSVGRLAVLQDGVVSLYDVSGVEVHGLGMQSGVIVVHTRAGPRPLAGLRRVESSPGV